MFGYPRWTFQETFENVNLIEGNWESTKVETHGYRFWLEARSGPMMTSSEPENQGRRNNGQNGNSTTSSSSGTWFRLASEPLADCEDYALLADFQIAIENARCVPLTTLFVEKYMITSESGKTADDQFWSPCIFSSSVWDCTAIVKVNIVEILSGRTQNLNLETAARDFALLIGGQSLFVDTRYLNDMGSPLFREWDEMRLRGQKRVVIQDWTADDMRQLLDSICTYRTPVVTCLNFEFLLWTASHLKIAKVLRRCEQFLIEAKTIHKIRKLELAAEYRLAMLADSVLRSFRRQYDSLESLHDYLSRNQESIDNVHPDVLLALNIFPDYLVV